MCGYLSNGNHLLESGSSSSLQPTPLSGDDATRTDIDMLEPGGGYSDVLHSEGTDEASWIVVTGVRLRLHRRRYLPDNPPRQRSY
jgi:hypothetical protein